MFRKINVSEYFISQRFKFCVNFAFRKRSSRKWFLNRGIISVELWMFSASTYSLIGIFQVPVQRHRINFRQEVNVSGVRDLRIEAMRTK